MEIMKTLKIGEWEWSGKWSLREFFNLILGAPGNGIE
jgi:hypothetical protein